MRSGAAGRLIGGSTSLAADDRWQMTIAINGIAGAGSPFKLQVQAQVADPLLTYAYGQLLSGKTGVGYRSGPPTGPCSSCHVQEPGCCRDGRDGALVRRGWLSTVQRICADA